VLDKEGAALYACRRVTYTGCLALNTRSNLVSGFVSTTYLSRVGRANPGEQTLIHGL
jgi:hypothetical protein